MIVSNNASGNTIGGTVSGAGNTIAFNVLDGSLGRVGHGRLDPHQQHLLQRQLGIDLVAPETRQRRHPMPGRGRTTSRAAPVLATAVGGGPSSGIQGTLNSVPSTPFLIQFFTSLIPDPSGFGQGQTPIGSMTVTTDRPAETPPSRSRHRAGLPANIWVTATATNTLTGDTSEFSNAVSALPVSVQFLTSTDLGRCDRGIGPGPRGARRQPQRDRLGELTPPATARPSRARTTRRPRAS